MSNFAALGASLANHAATLAATPAAPAEPSTGSAAPPAALDTALEVFAGLKAAQRELNAAVRNVRGRVSEAKLQMDRNGLQLQNVNYEKTHIENEIQRCQTAQYLFESIDLVDEEEFRRTAAPELLTYADEHQLMHNRLLHEQAERKRLLDCLQEMQEQKQKLMQQNKELQEKVDDVPGKLAVLRKEAASVLQKLGVPDVQLSPVVDQQAPLLPPPLYTLYTRLVGLQMSGIETVPTTIIRAVGDANSARDAIISGVLANDAKLARWGVQKPTFKNTTKIDTDEPGLDGNVMDVDDHQSLGTTSALERLHERYPMSLELVLRDGTTESPPLKFSYLTHLGIIVVASTDPYMLVDLFPGDTGTTSPHPAHAFLLDGSFEFQHRMAQGYAFYWAQQICSIDLPSPDSVHNPATLAIYDKNMNRCLPAVLQRLLSRIKTLRTLKVQLDLLTKNNMLAPLPSALTKLFPSTPSMAAVSEWKEVSDSTDEADSTGAVRPRRFQCVWKYQKDLFATMVQIPLDYPASPPLWTFVKMAQDGKEVVESDMPYLTEVEAEANEHWRELSIPGFEDKLLTLQLRRIAMCLDVCSTKKEASVNDRRKLSFNSESGVFESREPKEQTVEMAVS